MINLKVLNEIKINEDFSFEYSPHSFILFWHYVPLTTSNMSGWILEYSTTIDFFSITSTPINATFEGISFKFIANLNEGYYRIRYNTEVSNIVKVKSSNLSLYEGNTLLTKLPGYRFYQNARNLLVFLNAYANEFNYAKVSNYATQQRFLLLVDFLFDLKLNKLSNHSVLDYVNLINTIRGTRLYMNTVYCVKKIGEALTGNTPIIKRMWELPQIIIGDNQNVYYVIDRGIPPNFSENPPLRSKGNIFYGINIQLVDPLSIIQNNELDSIKNLYKQLLPVTSIIEVTK